MKKILILFLVLFIQKTNAQVIEITKATVTVTKNYAGNMKDTVLQNYAKITSNLLPISFLKFNVKWTGLNIASTESPFVNIYIYEGDNVLYTGTLNMDNFAAKDSTTINCPLLFASSPVGNSYGYYVRITHFPTASSSISNLDEKSNLWNFSFINDPNKIYNNSICCSKIVTLPYQPTEPLTQDPNAGTGTQTATQLPIKYSWEMSTSRNNFIAIYGATSAAYLPLFQTQDTYYRRIAKAYIGTNEVSYAISNVVSIARQQCTRPTTTDNAICGDQQFYNLVDGDVITPTKIIGSYIPWPTSRDDTPPPGKLGIEQGYQYLISNDGYTWVIFEMEHIVGPTGKPSDFKFTPQIFNSKNGLTQYIYIQRKYYELYDEWSCKDLFGFPHPCMYLMPHLKSVSNTVTLTFTSLSSPKPVVNSITNESGSDRATCNYSDQTKTFSVPRINNNETYKWEIPAGWIAYSSLEGPYANSITVSTNSGGAHHAKGGNVCLTIKQVGQINSMCKTIEGSNAFSVNLPNVLTGCEGTNIVVKPVILENNIVQSSINYKFNWEAYQSPNISCNTSNDLNNGDCKELKITIGNVYQNPKQSIKITATDAYGCYASATTTLATSQGLQMGILNSYNDPSVANTSNIALNEASNHLYFTAFNGNVIQRVYFDNTANIWRYAALKDKNTNAPITATGSVAFYKGALSDQLFYVNGGNIYYAETIDNGLTWTNVNNSAFATGADKRIKISGNNIYYIDGTTHKVFYISLINTATSVLVGNVPINYSQDMFAVEEGILAYADQSNNIIAFDAVTGLALPINVAANVKAVVYNSAISVYNKNIYFVSNSSASGALRILQKSSTSTSYMAYQDVSSQLAGPFTINKQTGTIYAKAYDIPGKQIYYLNGQWSFNPIKNYDQGSSIESSMVYGNGHAYYIGNGMISNTFYIAPCIPNVLRTSSNNTMLLNGDQLNDPIPVTRETINALRIYPNPTQNLARVNFTTDHASTIQIKMVSLTGTVDIVIQQTVGEGIQDIELPIAGYAAGVYIVQLFVEGELSASSKLIKY